MKNKVVTIIFIILLNFQFDLNAQDNLTATLYNPTFNLDCQNGKIDLHINGGYGPYSVSWSKLVTGPSGSYFVGISNVSGINGNNDGEDLENIEPGKYYVTVTDDLCGEAQGNFTINCECEDCEVLDVEKTQSTCDKGGTITVSLSCPESGHEPLSYLWSDGSTEKNRTNLDPGVYCVTITDAVQCIYSDCIPIGGVKAFDAGIEYKSNADDCAHGTCNGAIHMSSIGGTGNITYNWNNGATTQNIDNLCPYTYSVTVSDEAGCEKIFNTEILCCDRYGDDRIIIHQEEIKGLPLGKIETSVSGGIGDAHRTCVWRDTDGSIISYDCNGISNLTEVGRYCLTVNDGCISETKCFDIVDCNSYNISLVSSLTNTCIGYNLGGIKLGVMGGQSPFKFNWSNGSTSEGISNLGVGQYCATVTDAKGCSAQSCFTIQGDIVENVTSTTEPCQSQVTCNGMIRTVSYNYIPNGTDCNIEYLLCPATNENIEIHHPFPFNTPIYVRDCNKYRTCWDGSETLFEEGILIENGKAAIRYPDCPSGYVCANRYCYFTSGNYVTSEMLSFIDCAEAYFYGWDNDYGCCVMDIYCGLTYMFSFCTGCNTLAPNNDNDNLQSYLESHGIDEIAVFIDSTKTGSIEAKNLNENRGINLYPTMTSSLVFLEFGNYYAKDDLNLKIFDLNGKIINEIKYELINQKVTIDFSQQKNGIYFVLVNSSSLNKNELFKIVKI